MSSMGRRQRAVALAAYFMVIRSSFGLLLGRNQLSMSSSPPRATHWGTAEIDFSAANEYVRAHYGQKYSVDRPYFWASEKAVESVYDARRGVYFVGSIDACEGATLESCGFALLSAPTAVTDWSDMDEIRKVPPRAPWHPSLCVRRKNFGHGFLPTHAPRGGVRHEQPRPRQVSVASHFAGRRTSPHRYGFRRA
uniref:Uncharacterized protein n=1 Tax=Pseudictyota dubia TaxID=2749911 RepID=A0A7R9W4L6_9STRA|mmetsp:Transcript_32413/g.59593  ORF Transcript_32413/g.59593 Transcript_32413/m.59593 type:complete len:194 (+) Transcript_32413:231-812(+)